MEATARDIGALAEVLLAHLHTSIGLDGWFLTRFDRRTDAWVVVASVGSLPMKAGHTRPFQNSLCAAAIDGTGARVVSHIPTTPGYKNAAIVHELGIVAYVAAPVRAAGRTIGTVCGLSKSTPGRDLRALLPQVDAVATALSDSWQSKMATTLALLHASAMQRMALTDSLTGLPNRRAWQNALLREEARHRRERKVITIVVIDLDDLKPINDQHGHAAGDRVLRRAASALQSATRQGDVLARVGGDEFAVIAVHCDQSGSAVIKDRVKAALAQVSIAASVGAASCTPSESTLEATWAQADARMYRAKRERAGGRRWPEREPAS